MLNIDTYLPHDPRTWTHTLVTLDKDVTMREYTGRWIDNDPEFIHRPCLKGTVVKVTMISRFGDVGIHDDLTREYGYSCRIEPEWLTPVN